MKITKIVLCVSLIVVLLFATNLMSKPEKGSDLQGPFLAKATSGQLTRTLSNISNWSYWMNYNGMSGIDPNSNSGGIYPRCTAGAIFQDGFIWGGKVGTEIRVGGQTYNVGTTQGWIISEGVAVSSDDPRARIYRIRPDYETLTHAMVAQEAAEANMVSAASVTEAMTDEIIAQYETDWNEWPGDLGAPYEDINSNGVYDPAVDQAGIANADQVVWFVCNDLNRTNCMGLYGSEPIGIELQVTAWAYAQPETRLGQVVFKKYKMINKSGANVDEMYVAQWCDPDLGEAGDDLCGCDTTLSMGYAYNGMDSDPKYAAFGLAPAAVGYDFFQGPMVDGVAGQDINRNGVDDAEDYAVFDLKKVGPGKVNIPMTGFSWFAAGSPISDPTLGEYEGTLQWYNMLLGNTPTDNMDNPTPWTVGNEGTEKTMFPMAGDPVTGTGDLDAHASFFSPGDRRIALCSGPFTFADGETQEVVVAIIGGLGGTRFTSISSMKATDEIAQNIYNVAFAEVPKPPPGPDVKITPLESSVMFDWRANAEAVAITEEFEVLGYEFEGYNIYQLPNSSAGKSQATLIATYDLVNGIKTIMDLKLTPEYGEVEIPIQKGDDTGIKRYFLVERDYITGDPLYEGNTYYFAVTAYNQNMDLLADKALESPLIPLQVVIQESLPGADFDSNIAKATAFTHSIGSADGSVTYEVIDPSELTGHDYEVYFDQQHYYMDVDGQWKLTNYPDSVGKALGKVTDLTGTTISGIAYTSPTAGTRDLKFILDLQSPDYDYSDGVFLKFPSEVEINNAEVAVGGTYGSSFTPVIDLVENTVFWGGADTTGDGDFCGGEVFTVNVNTPTLPLDVDYIVWDDGWATGYGDPYASLGAGVVHAVGTCTITKEAYAFKTEKYWNLKDVTLNTVLLEDQSVMSGKDIYTGVEVTDGIYNPNFIVDGFRVNVDVGYAAPTDFTTLTKDGRGTYDIDSYAASGWAATAMCIDPDVWGAGSDDIGLLQKDYQLRFTGVYNADSSAIQEGTGSSATFVGSRNWDIGDHPMNPNPGSDDYFLIRIPFEVWSEDDDGNWQQVSILIYDRMQADLTAVPFYAFNPYGRMYCYLVNKPYDETAPLDPDDTDIPYLTWNLVFWETDWVTGDVLTIQYDNPIQLGIDKFTLKTTAPTTGDNDLAKEAVKKINVFPNPYYAYNALSVDPYDNYVTFTHLPVKATIRIFNLAGVLVRKLEKDDTSQFMQWNLANEANLPVASGMYIVHIDLPDLDMEKVLKIMIIQDRQILEYY